jgi:predicted nucleic acid-binding protein
MQIALDTNILLRLNHFQDPQHLEVRVAIRRLRSMKAQCCFFPQLAAEFWNVSTRPALLRGGYGQTNDVTRKQLMLLERLFTLHPDVSGIYQTWKNLIISHGVIGLQSHDTRVVAAMIEHGISHLLTYNTQDFTRFSEIEVHSPADLELLNKH